MKCLHNFQKKEGHSKSYTIFYILIEMSLYHSKSLMNALHKMAKKPDAQELVLNVLNVLC